MNDVEGFYELPKGWEWTTLGEIIEPSKEKVNPSDIEETPYIGLEHIEKDTGRLLDCGFSSEIRSTKSNFSNGDLLYGKLRPYLNKVCVPTFDGICSTDILVYSKTCYMSNEYLLYRFLYEDFVQYTSQNVSGVQHPRVNIHTLSRFEIALPPLLEQRRIVTKIEKLFTQLDAGISALEKAQAQLKRYRQSVLKAAVEGKLTEEWRREHPDVEPASVLLERIKREREKNAKGRRKKLPPMDVSNLPEIPEGWEWARLPQFGEVNRGKSKHRPRNDPKLYGGLYPFVQTGDIRHATGILHSYSQTYNELGLKQSQLWPKGTLCITIAANIADTAILGFDACFPDSIVGFLPEDDFCDVRFVEYFIRTAKENIERYAPATAQKNINLRILSSIAIPFPPLVEQHGIVSEIERRISVADNTEATLEANLKRAARLRQSILKKAFRGQLVPQNPNDEPASILLERIRAERAKTPSKRRRGRPRKKNAAKQAELIS